MNSLNEIQKISDSYKLLAACFYEPQKDVWQEELLCQNLASLLGPISQPAAQAAGRMAEALNQQNDEQLQVEHAALFVGPFELPAPPYGSIYLEQEKRLMGDSTMAVSRFYGEHGLKLDAKEAPDHIAIELEFLHYLCHRQAESLSQEDFDTALSFSTAHSAFLQTYLAPWVAGFCENILAASQNPFYRSLANCLCHFIEQMAILAASQNQQQPHAHATQPCRPSA